jgi:hypothetical protein
MKKAAVILSIIIMLVVSGCAGLPGRQKEPDIGYRRGSRGIVMKFLPNFPRPRMYDNEPFEVMLEIRNRGSYDVGFGYDRVYLSGFDIGIITGIAVSGKPFSTGLEGASQYNPEGGYDTIDFRGTIAPLQRKNIDSYPATILATACYSYKTIASENVCIDPDPFSPGAERKVCIPGPVGFGTQGAPIAVSNVDVEAAPRTTRFKIQISNVGGGTVFKSGGDYLSKCSPYHSAGLQYNDVDYVTLSKVEVAGTVITSSCKPADNQRNVRLTNGQATVFCELGGVRAGPTYTTPLTIELDYGYRSTITRSIEIIQIPS